MTFLHQVAEIVRSMVPYRGGLTVEVNHDEGEAAARQELATSNCAVREAADRLCRRLKDDDVIASFIHGVNALKQRDIAERGE